jgi:hypothetical protein
MQLAYDMYNNPMALGTIYDTSLRQVDTGLASGAIGIGKGVVDATNLENATNRGQIAQAGTGAGQGALIKGISLFSQILEQSAAGVVQYADKDAVPFMTKGRIVVMTNDAVVAGTVANFVLANGTWTDAAVGAGIEATVLIKVRFITSTSAAGLAAVEVWKQ